MNKENITGIVLAGGKSSRMGEDKGIMEFDGKKMVKHILDALAPVVDEIIIIANNNHYNDFGYPVYEDIIKDCGPMGGIYTGLTRSNTMKNIVLSCDMPFIKSKMVSYIIAESGDYEITVPKHENKLEPLCAIYSKKCADKLKGLLERKEWKMQEALQYFNTQQLRFSGAKEIEKNFININTLQDFINQSHK
jgi:molybdopterin-guanine dinucleotide biosynthesis protein A